MALILKESEVRAVLTMKDGIRLVEEGFEHYARGRTTLAPRMVMKLEGEAGTFRIMAAIQSSAISRESIHAELGDVVIGKKKRRERDRQITLFKSVGVAIEDVAAAAFVYREARAKGLGTEVDLQS